MRNLTKGAIALIGAVLIISPQARSQIDIQATVLGSGAIRTVDGKHLVCGTVGQSAIGHTLTDRTNASIGFWQNIPQEKAAVSAGEPPTTGSHSVVLRASPNPFSEATQLTLRIPYHTNGSLVLYNLLGQPVRNVLEATALDAAQPGGDLILNMSAEGLPSGRYTLILTTETEQQTIPLLLVR